MTKAAPQPRVLTPTYIRMSQFKCKYVQRSRHFSLGMVEKTHICINLERNKRTRGIKVSDNVC